MSNDAIINISSLRSSTTDDNVDSQQALENAVSSFRAEVTKKSLYFFIKEVLLYTPLFIGDINGKLEILPQLYTAYIVFIISWCMLIYKEKETSFLYYKYFHEMAPPRQSSIPDAISNSTSPRPFERVPQSSSNFSPENNNDIAESQASTFDEYKKSYEGAIGYILSLSYFGGLVACIMVSNFFSNTTIKDKLISTLIFSGGLTFLIHYSNKLTSDLASEYRAKLSQADNSMTSDNPTEATLSEDFPTVVSEVSGNDPRTFLSH